MISMVMIWKGCVGCIGNKGGGGGVRGDNRVDMGMCQEVCANDTLVVTVILKNYALDHVFAKSGLHGNYDSTMGVDNSTIGDFDFPAYRELK
uniref:Uncharacterized protein n=1 Tax=Romanomermis culicivorax TaxID=13658 RepID=A0A915K4B9_ROMCU